MKNTTAAALKDLNIKGQKSLCPPVSRISIGLATCGQATGAINLNRVLAGKKDLAGIAKVVTVGCLGACYAEPLVSVRTPDGTHYFYGKLDKQSLWHIIRAAKGEPVRQNRLAVAREREKGVLRGIQDLEFTEISSSHFERFLKPQLKRVTRLCGLIDPWNLNEYVAMEGYQALAQALFQLRPHQVIAAVEASGLRGRGGAGFPTGQKWRIAAGNPDPVKIVIANADEGDPGAYMDRALLESDPHSVLEGLILAGYAIGASTAYIFIRHEYSLAIRTLRKAISDAQAAGLLGERILGSDYSLEVIPVESAGAFVCGEETALLQIIENKRGEPRLRPPYPAAGGLWEHPTVVNNIETLANIPWILLNGPDDFRQVGTAKSPGTKIFCLTGDVKRMGFIEVPLGLSTQVLVEQIGGAAKDSVKALQIGGPSGGIIPYKNFQLDYETLSTAGAIMGSGGLVVLGYNRCVVDLARHLVHFMADESCGKCVACRDGLPQLELKLLSLTTGNGQEDTLREIDDLSRAIAGLALCGLGQTAVNPVLTSFQYCRDEYQAHVRGKCPALSCKPLIDFEINTACKLCRACFVVCPTGAVKLRAGQEGRVFVDRELCSKCWACYETCPFGLIKVTSEEYPWLRK